MNGNEHNVGNIENHCDKDTKEYYIKLVNGDKEAKKKQEEMLEEFLNDDRL